MHKLKKKEEAAMFKKDVEELMQLHKQARAYPAVEKEREN